MGLEFTYGRQADTILTVYQLNFESEGAGKLPSGNII